MTTIIMFLVLGILGALISILLCVAGLVFWIKVLAYLEWGFMYVASGETRRIDRGANKRRKWVMVYEGKHLNDPSDKVNFDSAREKWEVLDNKWEDAHGNEYVWIDSRRPIIKLLNDKLGVYPFWWPIDTVHWRNFEWVELQASKGEARSRPIPRSESVGSLFIKRFQYYGNVTNVLIKGDIRYDLHYLINLEISNPEKAEVETDNWLGFTLGKTDIALKNYAAGQTLDELRSEMDKKGTGTVNSVLLELNKEIPGITPKIGLPELAGVRLVSFDFYSIVPSDDRDGKKEEMERKQWEADQEAAAIRKKGEAEADVIEMKGKKQAEATKAVGMAGAEVTKATRLADAAGEEALMKAQTKNPFRTRVAQARELGKLRGTLVVGGKSADNVFVEVVASPASPDDKDEKQGEADEKIKPRETSHPVADKSKESEGEK